ncbi:MAG: V-type ATP synthase subunit F [Endomicrobiia bacterium]
MKSFIVIGDYESISIYKLFGWDVLYVNIRDLNSILEKISFLLKNNKYDKIFIIEDIYKILQEKFSSELEKTKISIIPIPGIRGSKNFAKQKYKKLAAIATGIKLE